MLSLDEINSEIIRLEQRDTTYANCERLAPLYIVRDHLREYTHSDPQVLKLSEKDEFLKAVNGKNADAVWNIVADMMQVIRSLHPKAYAKMMQDINKL